MQSQLSPGGLTATQQQGADWMSSALHGGDPAGLSGIRAQLGDAAAYWKDAADNRSSNTLATLATRYPEYYKPLQDVATFEAEALKRYKVDLPQVPSRYRTTYFDHIWGGGYSAGYYAYFWAEVLDHDAFQWFKEHGGLTAANGQAFREQVLSRGNSVELAKLYRDFRGKDPSVEPLLENRGLK